MFFKLGIESHFYIYPGGIMNCHMARSVFSAENADKIRVHNGRRHGKCREKRVGKLGHCERVKHWCSMLKKNIVMTLSLTLMLNSPACS